MMISAEGVIIRLQTEHIPSMGRTTQGVTLMRLNQGDAVVAVAKVVGEEETD
jgi:DNA gyrase subunit A